MTAGADPGQLKFKGEVNDAFSSERRSFPLLLDSEGDGVEKTTYVEEEEEIVEDVREEGEGCERAGEQIRCAWAGEGMDLPFCGTL